MNRAAKSAEFMQLGHPRRRRKATNVSLKKTGSRNGLSFLPLARMFTVSDATCVPQISVVLIREREMSRGIYHGKVTSEMWRPYPPKRK